MLRTPLCDLLGIEHPIMLAGMGGVSYSEVAAAVSEAGGFGCLGAAGMSYEEMTQEIRAVKAKTKKPFGVDLLTASPRDMVPFVETICEEGARAFVAGLGVPAKVVDLCHRNGVLVVNMCGKVSHAIRAVEAGCDIVVAQGTEAGGHTGQIATLPLVPMIADVVNVPVVAAGGIFDGRGLAGQLAVGASGVAMGTRFLMTKDSAVADIAKDRYLEASVTDTIVTRAIDGAPQRVIRTPLIDRLEKAKFLALPKAAANALRFRKMTGTSFASLLKEGLAMKKSQDLSWAQMAMAANAPMMTKAAIVDGHLEVGILPTGQGVGAIDDLPTCQELIDRIVAQTIEQLDRLCR